MANLKKRNIIGIHFNGPVPTVFIISKMISVQIVISRNFKNAFNSLFKVRCKNFVVSILQKVGIESKEVVEITISISDFKIFLFVNLRDNLYVKMTNVENRTV